MPCRRNLSNSSFTSVATNVLVGQSSDAEMGAAASDLFYAYYVHELPHKHKHQVFTQHGVELPKSHMCEIARFHVMKEPSQLNSQTTSQPLHTTHIGLTAWSEWNCSLATFQPTPLITPCYSQAEINYATEEPHGEVAEMKCSVVV
ncbi:unnamed protein product [Schistocephalus solidus]|uniref:FAS1 domain-containing protein n=1 Tax=Schistocephalus solidus TaxID=70667 RepID=A0A183S7C1_SCHSO|nr:unnamed protein product [Schistocephalus solidus]